jgi:hypothetical protein
MRPRPRRATLFDMTIDGQMSDVVLFELPDGNSADLLARRLKDSWVVWTAQEEDTCILGVELRPMPDDVAFLLRVVAEWAGERGFDDVPFLLDGRAYGLAPTASDFREAA